MDVGNYLWERGFYHQGIESLRLAIQVQEESPGQDLIEQSKVCTLLAALLHELGSSGREESEVLFVRSFEQRKQCVNDWTRRGLAIADDDLILWANAWNDIACVMLREGCYDQVDIVLSRSIELKQKQGIPEDKSAAFNFAENYINLGYLRTAQGRHTEAIILSERAESMMVAAMGARSPAAQLFAQTHAWALYSAGRLHEALIKHERVRQARIKIFGKMNAHTLKSYYACGVVHHCLGQLDEADGDWSLNCVPRVKFRLAMVMEDNGKSYSESQSLKADARRIHEDLSQDPLPFEITDGEDPDEMVIYDHMVPCEGGRSTIGRLHTELASLPLIAEVLKPIVGGCVTPICT
ncbi:transcriptional xre family [Colletotrichum higginsianum]|nr:transcriptional xre family [Colletotrichum higginsianum]